MYPSGPPQKRTDIKPSTVAESEKHEREKKVDTPGYNTIEKRVGAPKVMIDSGELAASYGYGTTDWLRYIFCSECCKQKNRITTNTMQSNLSDSTKLSDVKSTDIKSTDIKSTDIKSTDIKSTDIKSTDIKSTDIKLSDIKSTDIKSTDVKLDVAHSGMKSMEQKLGDAKPKTSSSKGKKIQGES